jgi:hypothetical protein
MQVHDLMVVPGTNMATAIEPGFCFNYCFNEGI